MDLRWHLVWLFTIIQEWKKKQLLNDIKKSYILGWFLAVYLQATCMSVISLRLHRAMWESNFMLLLFLNISVCGVRAKILKTKLQLCLLSTLKNCLHINLYFVQFHQTRLFIFISFKFMLSKININVSSFPALPQAALFIWWPCMLSV